jgi:hypothetical protein
MAPISSELTAPRMNPPSIPSGAAMPVAITMHTLKTTSATMMIQPRMNDWPVATRAPRYSASVAWTRVVTSLPSEQI